MDLRGRAGQDPGGLTPGVVLAGAITPHTLEVGARVVQVETQATLGVGQYVALVDGG